MLTCKSAMHWGGALLCTSVLFWQGARLDKPVENNSMGDTVEIKSENKSGRLNQVLAKKVFDLAVITA